MLQKFKEWKIFLQTCQANFLLNSVLAGVFLTDPQVVEVAGDVDPTAHVKQSCITETTIILRTAKKQQQ